MQRMRMHEDAMNEDATDEDALHNQNLFSPTNGLIN